MVILSFPSSSEIQKVTIAIAELSNHLPTAQEAAERLQAAFKMIKLRESFAIPIPSMERKSKKRKAWISPYSIGKRNH
jgi:hypothetical protein